MNNTAAKLTWNQEFELSAPRYARISDGMTTFCAELAPGQSLDDAIADYSATYDLNGEEDGNISCSAYLVVGGSDTDAMDFTV